MKPSPAIVRSRMLGNTTVLERSARATCVVLSFALLHCGGGEFSAGGSAGTGNDTSGGKAGSGGGGADAGGGGAGGSGAGGASGGKGGSATTDCECDAGEYCLDGSTDCLSCADLSRLLFEAPERLATVSDNGPGSRFPRIGATSTDLLYRFDGVGIRYTTDSSTSAGSSIAATDPQDSAPLLLREPLASGGGADAPRLNFFFDRGGDVGRNLRVGEWNDGLQSSEDAPMPLNSGLGDFSIAVALHPGPGAPARAFWMTNRPSTSMAVQGPHLVTALLETNTTVEDVELMLSAGQKSCPLFTPPGPPVEGEAIDPDLSPWVTADGSLLVFSTTRVDADCAAASQKKDIYTVLLQASSGRPPAAALPMKDVNSAADDVDPSFSSDMCDLYFASNRDGQFAVYRAHRR